MDIDMIKQAFVMVTRANSGGVSMCQSKVTEDLRETAGVMQPKCEIWDDSRWKEPLLRTLRLTSWPLDKSGNLLLDSDSDICTLLHNCHDTRNPHVVRDGMPTEGQHL